MLLAGLQRLIQKVLKLLFGNLMLSLAKSSGHQCHGKIYMIRPYSQMLLRLLPSLQMVDLLWLESLELIFEQTHFSSNLEASKMQDTLSLQRSVLLI